MAELRLFGSGGSIVADLTEEQAKAADLGVGKLFLAPIGKVEPSKMSGHACNGCKKEFDGPPKISPEIGGKGPEQVSENLLLVERGQYLCGGCGSVIGEYRVFEEKGGDAGLAVPSA